MGKQKWVSLPHGRRGSLVEKVSQAVAIRKATGEKVGKQSYPQARFYPAQAYPNKQPPQQPTVKNIRWDSIGIQAKKPPQPIHQMSNNFFNRPQKKRLHEDDEWYYTKRRKARR